MSDYIFVVGATVIGGSTNWEVFRKDLSDNTWSIVYGPSNAFDLYIPVASQGVPPSLVVPTIAPTDGAILSNDIGGSFASVGNTEPSWERTVIGQEGALYGCPLSILIEGIRKSEDNGITWSNLVPQFAANYFAFGRPWSSNGYIWWVEHQSPGVGIRFRRANLDGSNLMAWDPGLGQAGNWWIFGSFDNSVTILLAFNVGVAAFITVDISDPDNPVFGQVALATMGANSHGLTPTLVKGILPLTNSTWIIETLSFADLSGNAYVNIYYTTDGGSTYSIVYDQLAVNTAANATLLATDYGSRIWAAVTPPSIAYSSDGGATWTSEVVPSGAEGWIGITAPSPFGSSSGTLPCTPKNCNAQCGDIFLTFQPYFGHTTTCITEIWRSNTIIGILCSGRTILPGFTSFDMNGNFYVPLTDNASMGTDCVLKYTTDTNRLYQSNAISWFVPAINEHPISINCDLDNNLYVLVGGGGLILPISTYLKLYKLKSNGSIVRTYNLPIPPGHTVSGAITAGAQVSTNGTRYLYGFNDDGGAIIAGWDLINDVALSNFAVSPGFTDLYPDGLRFHPNKHVLVGNEAFITSRVRDYVSDGLSYVDHTIPGFLSILDLDVGYDTDHVFMTDFTNPKVLDLVLSSGGVTTAFDSGAPGGSPTISVLCTNTIRPKATVSATVVGAN